MKAREKVRERAGDFRARDGRLPSESDYAFRIGRGERDAGVLRVGEAEPVVHIGVFRSMRPWVRVWLPSGRLALWSARGNLVGGRRSALVAGGKLKVTPK
jgi:hypothetical protein